jgi:integrase
MFCNSPSTKTQYPRRLKLFFDFIGLPGKDLEEQGQAFLDNAKQQDRNWPSQQIMIYLDHEKQRVLRKEISAGTLKTLWTPIKTFCDAYVGDLPPINWKRISKSMPRFRPFSSDRVQTLEEIRKLVDYPDRRIKAIIYTMASSGIRIGACDYLKWKHIVPIKDDKTGEIQAAKIIVYAGEPEEYFSFITPEAYQALKAYMDFRAMWGEHITGESWAMRDYFRTADVKRKPDKNGKMKGGATGVATRPKLLTSKAMGRMLTRAYYEQGLRESLQQGTRRHDFKTAHGFRKFFKTRAEQTMNRLNVEYLLGHSVGMNSNYYRPTEQELLSDYLKALPSLTVNEDITNIKKHQEALEQRQVEKEGEIQELKLQQENNSKQLQTVIQLLGELVSKSSALGFEDIKWPILDIMSYYQDKKGGGGGGGGEEAGLSMTKGLLKRWWAGKEKEKKEKE